MKVSDFDYYLPEELIAQHPAEKRDASRLMVLHMDTGAIEHRHFYDILDYLRAGDCLVLNDSKVIPARLYCEKKETGAKVELLLIKRAAGERLAFLPDGEDASDVWECIVRPGKRLKGADELVFPGAEDFSAKIAGHLPDGGRLVKFSYKGAFMERLSELGHMPLPPYIGRKEGDEPEDKERYQTVYAREEGSVAAPTAGLHFTEELLKKAEEKGVKIAKVTLHVGIGTFRPVKAEKVEEHEMHFEEYEIDEENARVINETMASGGRIISVGTTSTRTLESAAIAETPVQHCHRKSHKIKAGRGSTGIFIYPGYDFKIIDCLITNFHLPKSTLIMLCSALYDREKVLAAYKLAVEEKYRFFSYGDACFFVRD